MPSTPEEAAGPSDQPSRERLRVGWVAGAGTLSRLGRVLESLSVGLVDELVDLVVLHPQPDEAGMIPSPPIELVPYVARRWWSRPRSLLDGLAGRVRPRGVKLLHALDAESAPLARDLARRLKVPYVVSSYAIGDGRHLHASGANLAAVLAASEPVRKDLVRHKVAAARDIHLLRPGTYQVPEPACFDNPEFVPAVIAGTELRDYRAYAAVLEAFARVRETGLQCAWFLMGSGRAERKLRARAEQLGIRESLTLVDRQSGAQLPAVFRAADVFVSPAPTRAVDVDALLAICAGLPVLAAAEGPSDFLQDETTALTFPAGDAGALAEKLAHVLAEPQAARKLVERALAYVREHHSAARMVRELAEVYRGVSE